MENIEVDLNDDFFKKLNTKEAYKANEEQLEGFWETLQGQISTEFIQNFGIQELLDRLHLGDLSQFKKGGNVSTVHNAQNGVFVDDEHQRRFNESFNRKNYEGRIVKDSNGTVVKDNRLKTQRKEIFQNNDEITDDYTHKPLKKDGSTHLDHVTSAKHIHENDDARLYMSDEERNDMAVSPDNMATIDGRMNQSKGEQKLSVWRKKEKNGQTNGERFGVDEAAAKEKQRKSEKYIKHTVNKAKLKEFNSAAKGAGVQQAKRQVCGVIMYEFSNITIDEIRNFAEHWSSYKKLADKIAGIRETFKKIERRFVERVTHIKELFSELSEAMVSGFVSGVSGTLTSFILNKVITVLKSWGKILQDGLSSFIQGLKLLVTNPDQLPQAQLFKSVLKIIAVGLSTSVGLVIKEKLSKFLKRFVPNYLVDVVSTSVSALISGCLSAIALYSVDHLGRIIQKFSGIFNDLVSDFKVGVQVSSHEISNAYQEALTEIDDAYTDILSSIEQQYKKIGELANLAHDMTLLASDQLFSSVSYARISGVEESKILHNSDEISKYFLG